MPTIFYIYKFSYFQLLEESLYLSKNVLYVCHWFIVDLNYTVLIYITCFGKEFYHLHWSLKSNELEVNNE